MRHTAARRATETSQINLLRISAWCALCGRQERMITPREAADHCSVSTRTIYRWAEGGRLHRVETRAGTLICFNSLYC